MRWGEGGRFLRGRALLEVGSGRMGFPEGFMHHALQPLALPQDS